MLIKERRGLTVLLFHTGPSLSNDLLVPIFMLTPRLGKTGTGWQPQYQTLPLMRSAF